MKFFTLMALVVLLAGVGCASRKPKSSSRIIMVGDENPYITDDPGHAGDVTRNSPR